MTEYSIADLELINFKSWDEALDFYNKVKANHPDLTFETWYEQQKNWIAFQEMKRIKEEELLAIQSQQEMQTLLQILSNMFKMNREEDERREEWNPWDELEDEENDDWYEPPPYT